jgi:exodeoxyribonuclease VII large subunit
VVAGRDELLGRVDQLSDRLRATLRDTVRRLLTSVLELDRRPGVAGWPARLAIRGRHAAELTHALTQATRSTLVTRERRLRSAQLKLEAHEPGRRVEASRTRLVVAGERLGAAIVHRRQRLEGRLGDLTGRLEALSPLGVLARGYAVCWNANRTAIVRDASAVSVGDDVAITLRQGQLTCTVTGKD